MSPSTISCIASVLADTMHTNMLMSIITHVSMGYRTQGHARTSP